MNCTRLKPYVYKIKGAKNYALYDLLKGNFYVVTPEGNVDELKIALRKAGLTFETGGTVPFKTVIDLDQERETVKIRELQIRLNGRAEDNCWNRHETAGRKGTMGEEVLQRLREQLASIPVKRVYMEAESSEPAKISFILSKFPFQEAVLFVKEGVKEAEAKRYAGLCLDRNVSFRLWAEGRRNVKELRVEIYDFFYSHYFNPCLGQQVAVDCGGEIRPCLWWQGKLGTILRDDLLDMIVAGIFDPYWELNRDKIEGCRDCELRYACPDCRVGRGNEGKGEIYTGKPTFCTYNPYRGKEKW